MVTQAKRSAATRARLLATFRSSLLTRGLDATTTQTVLKESTLSKGAMYHHFRSKDEVIEALYAHESEAAIERAFTSSDPDKPALERLKEGCFAWFKEIRDPEVAAILFDIGPSALGKERARYIEDRHGIARIRALLREAEEEGALHLEDVQLAAAFVNALVGEATLYSMKGGRDVTASLANAIDALLAGLGGSPASDLAGRSDRGD